MKDSRINPIERFVIRHHVALRWTFYVVFLLAFLIVNIMTFGREIKPLPYWAIVLITLVFAIIVFWVDFAGVSKLFKMSKTYTKDLDLKKTVEYADKMLEILKPNQLDYIGTSVLCKAAALCDMGKYNEAKTIAFDYLNKCDVKNAPYANMAENNALLALIALKENSIDEYKYRRNLVERCTNDSSRLFKFLYNRSAVFNELDLTYRIRTEETYDEELEVSVLTFPEFKNGKPVPEKKRTPMSYIAAYSMLFDYFRRLNMQEKAHYYARKICRLANEQFKSYREAKEYLDNEDIAD